MSSKYCWFCFSPKGSARACPFCGAIEGGRNREDQLQSGMELIDRYVVGGASDGGGNGVIYLAVDLQDAGRLVRIKEFIPKGYARRSDLSYDIITDRLDAVKFEQRKALILNQARELIKSGRYSDVFCENNTVYVVSPLKRTDTPAQELSAQPEPAVVHTPEQQLSFEQPCTDAVEATAVPESRPIPDIPEYIPPTINDEASQGSVGFENIWQDDLAEPAYQSYGNSAASFASAEGSQNSKNDKLDIGGIFARMLATLKSFFSKLGGLIDGLFDRIADMAVVHRLLRLVDNVLKKDRSLESSSQRHERSKKFSIVLVSALLLILLLVIILVGTSSCGA